MVRMSYVGMSSGKCSSWASYAATGLPRSITQASSEVPPMSNVSTLSRPSSEATYAAPTMPPAGPDSTVCVGAVLATALVIEPPPDRMIRKRPAKPRSARPASSSSTYRSKIGRMYASSTVVLVRSYSRYSRTMSVDSDRLTSGNSSWMRRAASRSWLGSRNECRKQMAIEVTCWSTTSVRAAARTLSGSSGSTTRPR